MAPPQPKARPPSEPWDGPGQQHPQVPGLTPTSGQRCKERPRHGQCRRAERSAHAGLPCQGSNPSPSWPVAVALWDRTELGGPAAPASQASSEGAFWVSEPREDTIPGGTLARSAQGLR